MESQHFTNPAGWAIVLIGLALATLAALTPHFGSGYYLDAGILTANLLPYMVYAVAVPLIPGVITTSAGLILLAAHTGLVFSERFIDGADYSDGLIYTMPVLLALMMLPVAIVALLKTATHKAVQKPVTDPPD